MSSFAVFLKIFADAASSRLKNLCHGTLELPKIKGENIKMMTLCKEDAELYYELWFPLLDFVNEKLKVNPTIGKIHGAQSLNIVEVKEIANALWGDCG